MNRDLAIELQIAGFPLEAASREDAHDSKRRHQIFEYGFDSIGRAGSWLHPTLEELIEACEDGFYELHRDTDDGKKFYWCATADNDLPKYEHVLGTYGTTAIEAVARLWLALNKK